MKNIKKIVFTLFIVTLCLSLLPSCGKSAPGKTETAPETTKGTEAVSPATTEAPATEPATSEPAETDPTTPEEQTMPSQDYVGAWYTDESKEMTLRILEIDSDFIIFQANPAPEEYFIQVWAAEVDGKILFGNKYVPEGHTRDENLAGSLEFNENGITVTYEDFGDTCKNSTPPPAGTSYVYTIKSETDLIDWPSDKVPGAAAAVIQDAVDELKEKGWTDIEVMPHEPDYTLRWQAGFDPYPLNEGDSLFSVVGRTGKTFCTVIVTLDSTETEAERAEVFYVGTNGRRLRGTDLENFLNGESSPDVILQADDQKMQDFFWTSY